MGIVHRIAEGRVVHPRPGPTCSVGIVVLLSQVDRLAHERVFQGNERARLLAVVALARVAVLLTLAVGPIAGGIVLILLGTKILLEHLLG